MNNTRLIYILTAVIAALTIGVGIAQATNQSQAPLIAGVNGSRCTYTTISAAANAAATGQTIYILPGTYREALGNISKSLTFVPAVAGCGSEDTSANSDTVVIDASGQASDGTGGLVEVQGFSDMFTLRPRYVTFRHMTLRDGSATNGGVLAATNAGNVTLEDVNIIGGNATNGGGIYANNGVVTLTDDSEVTGNEATNGGGIYANSSTINLSDVYVGKTATTGNTASSAGGGVYVDSSTIHMTIQGFVGHNEVTDGDGGGIYSINSDITHNISKVEYNEADGKGGGVYLSDGSYTMTGGVIRHNRAFEVTSGNQGGGIYATGKTDILISQAQVAHNTGNQGGGVYLGGGVHLTITNGASIHANSVFADGGGLYAYGYGTDREMEIAVTDSAEFTHNNATIGAGIRIVSVDRLLLQNDVTLEQNSSKQKGGAIDGSATTFIMSGVVITGNTAGYSGGGLNIWASSTHIEDSLISHNRQLSTTFNTDGGGGIRLVAAGPATISNTQILNNESDRAGGGLFLWGNNDMITVTESVIAFNHARQWGGGLFANSGSSPLKIADSIITNNSTDNSGGGLFVNGRPFELRDSTLGFNDSDGHGGGIAIVNDEPFLLQNNTIRSNEAKYDGGGILISCGGEDGQFLMANNHIHSNTASRGGGVALTAWSRGSNIPCPVESRNEVIEGNGALYNAELTSDSGYGGGVLVENSKLLIRGWPGSAETGGCDSSTLAYDMYCSELRGNQALVGGAVYLDQTNVNTNSHLSIESTAILANQAEYSGSAILIGQQGDRAVTNLANKHLAISGSYIRDNGSAADTDADVITGVRPGTIVTITSSTIVDNFQRPLFFIDGVEAVSIIGTVIDDNTEGSYIESGIPLTLTNNYLEPHAIGSQPMFSTVNNSLTPGFITDPARGPHRITFTSNLAEAANQHGFPIDADLLARPAGNRFDIGAFEYGADPAVPTAVALQAAGTREQSVALLLVILAMGLSGLSFCFRPKSTLTQHTAVDNPLI